MSLSMFCEAHYNRKVHIQEYTNIGYYFRSFMFLICMRVL